MFTGLILKLCHFYLFSMFLFSTLEMRLLQLLIPLPWTPPPRISHVGILLDVLENQGHFFFFHQRINKRTK